MHGRLLCHGSAIDSEQLKLFISDNSTVNDDWKGDQPNILAGTIDRTSMHQVLLDLHNQSDLVILEAIAVAKDYKDRAIANKMRPVYQRLESFLYSAAFKECGC